MRGRRRGRRRRWAEVKVGEEEREHFGLPGVAVYSCSLGSTGEAVNHVSEIEPPDFKKRER